MAFTRSLIADAPLLRINSPNFKQNPIFATDITFLFCRKCARGDLSLLPTGWCGRARRDACENRQGSNTCPAAPPTSPLVHNLINSQLTAGGARGFAASLTANPELRSRQPVASSSAPGTIFAKRFQRARKTTALAAPSVAALQ